MALEPMIGARTRGPWPVLAILCSLMLADPSAAGEQPDWWESDAVGLGPILLRSQAPASLLRLTPTPLAPSVVPEGNWHIGTVINWNNYILIDEQDRYLIDAETVRVTAGAIYGLSEKTDIAIAFPASYRGGGTLDSFIEEFERTVGQFNEDRLLFPQDQYRVRIDGGQGNVFELGEQNSGWGLEDTIVRIRHQLSRGDSDSPSLLLSTALKLPTGDRESLRSSGGVDVALGIATAKRFGRAHAYLSVEGIRYATTEVVGIRLQQSQWSVFSGLEYRWSPRTSWLLQLIITSPAATNFGAFSESTYELTIGFKRRITDDLLLEVGVLENLFVFDNSPDVGFHFGLIKRLR